jgi:hypothetical protein
MKILTIMILMMTKTGFSQVSLESLRSPSLVDGKVILDYYDANKMITFLEDRDFLIDYVEDLQLDIDIGYEIISEQLSLSKMTQNAVKDVIRLNNIQQSVIITNQQENKLLLNQIRETLSEERTALKSKVKRLRKTVWSVIGGAIVTITFLIIS